MKAHTHIHIHINEDAMKHEPIIDITGIELSPGQPKLCKGNGTTLDEQGQLIECCCDECDYLQLCTERDAEDNEK